MPHSLEIKSSAMRLRHVVSLPIYIPTCLMDSLRWTMISLLELHATVWPIMPPPPGVCIIILRCLQILIQLPIIHCSAFGIQIFMASASVTSLWSRRAKKLLATMPRMVMTTASTTAIWRRHVCYVPSSISILSAGLETVLLSLRMPMVIQSSSIWEKQVLWIWNAPQLPRHWSG